MRPAFSFSAYLMTLPFEFIHWWFIDSSINLIKILKYSLAAVYNLLGVSSIFKTFFKPWKNEYREGLANFAVFMSILIKSMLLISYSIFFTIFIALEFAVLVLWVLLPIIILWGVYRGFYAIIFS